MFLFAYRSGFNLFEAGPASKKVLVGQDLKIRPLAQLLQPEWNPLCKKPMCDWLNRGEADESHWADRVHCCGNIVVPFQAAAALQIVARLPLS